MTWFGLIGGPLIILSGIGVLFDVFDAGSPVQGLATAPGVHLGALTRHLLRRVGVQAGFPDSGACRALTRRPCRWWCSIGTPPASGCVLRVCGRDRRSPRDNRLRDVVGDQICVKGNGSGRSFAGSGDHLRARVRDVARDPDARDARPSGAVGDAQPSSSRSQPSSTSSASLGTKRGGTNSASNSMIRLVSELDATQLIIVEHNPLDGSVNDGDRTSSPVLRVRSRSGFVPTRGRRHRLTTDGRSGRSRRAWRPAEHSENLVAHLEAVAVGAMEHIPRPPLPQPRDLRELIPKAGRDKQPAGGNRETTVKSEPESPW